MPWSPIPKFPEIQRELRKNYGDKALGFETINIVIMKHTGIMRAETIKRTIQAMEDLGYLKQNNEGRWLIPKKVDIQDADRNEILKENTQRKTENEELMKKLKEITEQLKYTREELRIFQKNEYTKIKKKEAEKTKKEKQTKEIVDNEASKLLEAITN